MRLADDNSRSLGSRWYIQNQMRKAMSGDMVLVISPEAVAPEPTSDAWERTVKLSLQDADGNVHTWFNGSFATTLSIADDSEAGEATIESTTLTLVEGEAEVVVSGDAKAWLATETDTLTVADLTIMGTTVSGGTSVETFTA